jgi:hypothetical protein
MNIEVLIHTVDRGIQYVEKPDLVGAQAKLENAYFYSLMGPLVGALEAAGKLLTAYGEARACATSNESAITSLHAGHSTLGVVRDSGSPHAKAMLESSTYLLSEEPIQLSRLDVLCRVVGEAATTLTELVDNMERLEPLHTMAGEKAELMARQQKNVSDEGITYLQDLTNK